jgi:hypothetical protein
MHSYHPADLKPRLASPCGQLFPWTLALFVFSFYLGGMKIGSSTEKEVHLGVQEFGSDRREGQPLVPRHNELRLAYL